ncbi:DNA helicase RecQ [Cytophagaceae bacterium DM2B3-1]|uniref:DNA helicase RecQ n=1 Tax=Xanthocytophaga flava TaxID=3048013 RepID=A0ABT7CL83_9BACT|nr:DNA helicase RecQ [Xanthocytophaga flavus]MDJ1469947.1 DNA helicase RecQ [Xanthocytophaga flavus]MDJ1494457.1 DNA helicase RecQ [Xanthocytophaga flavus]
MLTDELSQIKETLKDVFGYSQFRGTQEEIIQSILAGRNTFVIMPTGAGKSLCYQLPAIVMSGTAIVISPLIALMKNQVDQLNAVGINAQFLNSTLSKAEITKVKKDVLNGEIRLLYVAPESLTKEENIDLLKRANISFVAVDEAHCISEWGHDFRPEYRKIRGIIENLGKNLPIIALTATATPKVQTDIQRNLDMDDAELFKSSFNRKNLYYEVRPKVDAKKQLIKYIKNHKGKSGIIYCLSRKKVEEIAELLSVNDIKALPYHAGLDASIRMANQDAFLNEDVDVIVATIAFGMGIDKPDVRFVIHYDAPKSLEGYYQETGRSGRDGLEGNCIMFYSYNDILKLEKFNKDKPVTERDNAKHLLQEMAAYAESSVCRRRQLLHYFGEQLDHDCGYCDNCLKPREKFEAQDDVVLAVQAVIQTESRFGVPHLVDVLRGVKNDYVISYGHDKLKLFGVGAEKDVAYWTSVYRQITIYNFLEKDVDVIGIARPSAKGLEFVDNPYPVTLTKDHDYSNVDEESDEDDNDAGNPSTPRAADETLFEMLKALRKKIAKEKGLPPYVIFQDPSLEEMATTYPTTKEELAQINGVGGGKVAKFGKPFLELIAKYVAENDIETDSDVLIKSTANKSKTKIFIIQQIDRKINLDEIAESKVLTMADLIEEIEHICYSGTRLNLDYYIDQILDEDKQQDIWDYFISAETDSMKVALAEMGDDFSEEELRLMRIKFLSEVAN